MLEFNKIHNMDCVEGMKLLQDECIDLTVTSPPYDELRTYKGYKFRFKETADQLYRVTKKGGVVVWVVADETKNGSETGTSFRQALYFMEIGFNLHDTMIYEKNSMSMPSVNRYHQKFEYMFVFSKGKPKTFNPIMDHENTAERWSKDFTTYDEDGEKIQRKREIEKNQFGMRFNIWKFNTGFLNGNDNLKHPAIFPEKLAMDHIASWSNENEVVMDPFMGSGTTAKASLLLSRQFIGFEISEEYHEEANKRIYFLLRQEKLF